jgi:predicted peroxiredoxin
VDLQLRFCYLVCLSTFGKNHPSRSLKKINCLQKNKINKNKKINVNDKLYTMACDVNLQPLIKQIKKNGTKMINCLQKNKK